MSVIEALMVLYAKEIAAGDRIATAVHKLTGGTLTDTKNFEAAFLNWVQHVCAALKRRVERDSEYEGGQNSNGQRYQFPDVSPLRDYKDLCDGVCLAFVVAYYCPNIVPWTSVKVNYLPTVEVSYISDT